MYQKTSHTTIAKIVKNLVKNGQNFDPLIQKWSKYDPLYKKCQNWTPKQIILTPPPFKQNGIFETPYTKK